MTEKRLRILMLADGRSIHTTRFADELRRQGCEVIVASVEGGGEQVVRLPKRGVGGLHFALLTDEVRQLVNRHRPHVINPHFATGYGLAAGLARTRSSPPVALNLWGSDILQVPQRSFVHRWKTVFALRAAALVFADSEYCLLEAGKLARLESGYAIPWGVERQALSLHKKSYALDRPCRIIVPRAHATVYRSEAILHGLRDLIVKGVVTVTFPSFGPRQKQFRRRARDLIGKGVQLYDPMPRTYFLDFMAEHDIYLSNAARDSSPVSLIEAMGLGLIPVVADIPGVDDWIDGDNGLRFDGTKPESMREVILSIVDSGDEHHRLREENRKLVERRGIFEDNVARHLKILSIHCGAPA